MFIKLLFFYFFYVNWMNDLKICNYIKSISLKDNKKSVDVFIEERNDFFKKRKNLSFKKRKLIQCAKNYLGTPYLYGGNSKLGIDCSSFIISVFKFQNIYLPRLSIEQSKKGIKIPVSEVEEGDLLFFATGLKNIINHVGLVIENKGNNILFIHSSSSNGVIISQIKDYYWRVKFMFAKRIFI